MEAKRIYESVPSSSPVDTCNLCKVRASWLLFHPPAQELRMTHAALIFFLQHNNPVKSSRWPKSFRKLQSSMWGLDLVLSPSSLDITPHCSQEGLLIDCPIFHPDGTYISIQRSSQPTPLPQSQRAMQAQWSVKARAHLPSSLPRCSRDL